LLSVIGRGRRVAYGGRAGSGVDRRLSNIPDVEDIMNLVKRRDLLAGLGSMSFCLAAGCSTPEAVAEKDVPAAPAAAEDTAESDLRLRPHHILDIITSHGQGIVMEPSDYGHSQHLVAERILSNPDLTVKLVVQSDDICTGCKHLMADGKCDDVLAQLTPSPSKQAYNDVLDCRLLDLLGIEINSVMTVRAYLDIVNGQVPGIEAMCTHPKEDQAERLAGLAEGLVKLGIRDKA